MADFNVGLNPIASSAPVLQGVVRPPSPVASGVVDIFSSITAIGEGKKEEVKQGKLGQFTNDQLAIAQGVATGQFTSAHGDILLRQNLMKSLQSNPASWREDIITAYKDINGIEGGVDIVSQGTEEGNRELNTINAMSAEGVWNDEWRDDLTGEISAEGRDAIMAFNSLKGSMLQLTYSNALMTNEKSGMELDAARDKINADRQRIVMQESLRAGNELQTLSFKTDISQIFQSYMGKDGSMDREGAIRAIEQSYQTIEQTLNDQYLGLDATLVAQYLAPFQAMKDSALRRASGEVSVTVSDNEIKNAINRGKISFMQSDPDIALWAATSSLFNGSAIIDAALTEKVMSALERNSRPPAEDGSSTDPANLLSPDEKKAAENAGYFSAIIGRIDVEDELDEKGQLELGHQINSVLDGLLTYKGVMERNPAAGNQMRDFFANPEFFEYIKDKPQYADKVAEVAEQMNLLYTNEILNIVKTEFQEATVINPGTLSSQNGKQISVGSSVTPAPEAVTWVVKSDGIRFVAVDPESKVAAAKAKELNGSLGSVLNSTLRAQSHLLGRQDYGTFMEESYELLMKGPVGDNNLTSTDQLSYSNNPEYATENITPAAVNSLQSLMTAYPELNITSGYRTEEHNKEVGGASNSQHLHGNAFDVSTRGMSQAQILELIAEARRSGFMGIGVYDNSVHFDVGSPRAWGPNYSRSSFPEWALPAIEGL